MSIISYKYIKNFKKKIFPIGFGCGIGNYKNSNYSYKKHLSNAVKLAFDLNCNFFDTAPVYGNRVSEIILGNSFSSKQKDKMIITTKISPGMLSKSNIIKSVDESRKNLKSDILDLVQVHWPNPNINLFETMDTLFRLQKDNIINSIGICNYSFADFKKIIRRYGANFLSTFQTEYNLFDRTVDGNFYNFLLKNKIILLAYSPLAQGKIFNGSYQGEILREMSIKYNITIPQIVLNWLSNKRNILPLVNSSNKKRIIENFESINEKISKENLLVIDKKCNSKVERVEVKNIIPFSNLTYKNYKNVFEAKKNFLGFSPSPSILAQEILKTKTIKPIRVTKKSFKDKKLYLIEGRLRFWAWIIAFGRKKKIPTIKWINY